MVFKINIFSKFSCFLDFFLQKIVDLHYISGTNDNDGQQLCGGQQCDQQLPIANTASLQPPTEFAHG